VLHSGTVGAALTAAALGIPAVAVSIGWGDEEHYETAATIAAASLEWVAQAIDPARVLNLNVPNLPLDEVRGVREAHLAAFSEQWHAEARHGELLLEYVGHETDPAEGTDLALVREGYAAATVLTGVAEAPHSGAAEAIEHALTQAAQGVS
jgi:5'-nucleotidase